MNSFNKHFFNKNSVFVEIGGNHEGDFEQQNFSQSLH